MSQKPPTSDGYCPDCGGEIYDNRRDKRNPRAPDYRCRDQECGWKHWLTKRPGRQARTPSGNGAGLDDRTRNRMMLLECIVRATAEVVSGQMTGMGTGPEAVAGTLSLIEQVHGKFLALSIAGMDQFPAVTVRKPEPAPVPEPPEEEYQDPEPPAGPKW